MKRFRLLVLVVGLVFGVVLFGCDKAKDLVSGDVSLVKNGTMEFDKSLTVGQALDKYKYFKSTKWEAVKTDNGRRLVNVVGDLDISRYPYLNSDNTPAIKSAYVRFQFIINQDKTFELKWCGLGAEKKDGTKTEPDESANLLMCKNSMKEIYDNGPKEASTEEKATIKSAANDKEGCSELMSAMRNSKTLMEADFADNQKYPDHVPFEVSYNKGMTPPGYIAIKRINDISDTQNYALKGASEKCSKAYQTSRDQSEVTEMSK
jgi:hypothetical protein